MNRGKFACIVLAFILLAGCSGLPGLPRLPLSALPTTTVTPLPTATETPGPTATPPMPENCAYVWSNRSLPEVAQMVNQALRDAGIPEVDAQAAAYGEDCLDPDTNTVAGFRTMQTDFYFSVAVQDVSDAQIMGDIVEKILRVLDSMPAGEIPGPNMGYVGVTFDDSSQTSNLWFPRTRGKELLKQNVSGGALYEELASQQ